MILEIVFWKIYISKMEAEKRCLKAEVLNFEIYNSHYKYNIDIRSFLNKWIDMYVHVDQL